MRSKYYSFCSFGYETFNHADCSIVEVGDFWFSKWNSMEKLKLPCAQIFSTSLVKMLIPCCSNRRFFDMFYGIQKCIGFWFFFRMPSCAELITSSLWRYSVARFENQSFQKVPNLKKFSPANSRRDHICMLTETFHHDDSLRSFSCYFLQLGWIKLTFFSFGENFVQVLIVNFGFRTFLNNGFKNEGTLFFNSKTVGRMWAEKFMTFK